jgi:hypothetical protein
MLQKSKDNLKFHFSLNQVMEAEDTLIEDTDFYHFQNDKFMF